MLFAATVPVGSAVQDVDRDGDLDLLLYFNIQTLDLDTSSTEATLIGATFNGTLIQGSDMVNILS